MSQFKSCLITPSYKQDFARCSLLAQSIDNFAVSDIHHYLIVDRRDLRLFQQLENSNRTVITVESILPWWIYKIPVLSNGWFSWKTLPLRNWLVQQIVKLKIANHLSEDVLIFVDSDVTFIRAFDHKQFVQNGKVRLFRENILPSPIFNLDTQIRWRDTATSLLGLSSFKEVNQENPFIGYVGNLITWKRENVLKLHQHIEKVTQKFWLKAIAECWHLSEYMLYGIFVDRVLQENSGHYWDCLKPSHDYWGTIPLEKEQLQQFFRDISPQCFAVMISSKSKTPIASYAPFIQQMSLKLKL